MAKAKLTFTLLIFILINLIPPFSSFAQAEPEEETLTFTTYYPAPYGVYNEMRANRDRDNGAAGKVRCGWEHTVDIRWTRTGGSEPNPQVWQPGNISPRILKVISN